MCAQVDVNEQGFELCTVGNYCGEALLFGTTQHESLVAVACEGMHLLLLGDALRHLCTPRVKSSTAQPAQSQE